MAVLYLCTTADLAQCCISSLIPLLQNNIRGVKLWLSTFLRSIKIIHNKTTTQRGILRLHTEQLNQLH